MEWQGSAATMAAREESAEGAGESVWNLTALFREHRSALAVGVVAVALYVYWAQFHEVNKWLNDYLSLPVGIAGVSPALGGFLNCALRPLGLVVGCLVILIAKKSDRRLHGWCVRLLMIPLLILGVALYGAAYFPASELFVLSCGFFISLLMVYPMLYLFLSIASLGRVAVLFITVGALVASKLYSVLVMAPAAAWGGPLAAFAMNALPLVCAFVLWKRADLQPLQDEVSALANGPAALKRVDHRAARPLVTHLVSYGFGLGLFHAMLGVGFNIGGSERTVVDLVGVAIAGVVALVFLRKLSLEEELWQNVRGIVFPSAIIGFLLIPISTVYVVSAVLEEFSLSYYAILFALGCFLMMRNTVLDSLSIALLGLLFKSVGSFVGIALGSWLAMSHVAVNLQAISITTAVVFSAFTLGTFWLGKDSDLRKWWGLRRNYTAQQFRDQLIEQKAAHLAEQYGLSQREQEILVMLAQGKRAQQIGDELYVTIYTVRKHTQNIYNKLDVHSFSELDTFFSSVKLED